MKKIFFHLLIIAAAGVVFYSGCDDTLTGDEVDNRVIPDQNVKYNEHLQPVFDLKCATAGCHDNQTRAGGLSLTSWANTTADPTIVFPGEPDNSRLVWTIDPRFASPNPMPPIGYPVLTANQIKGIRTWISEGAKNN